MIIVEFVWATAVANLVKRIAAHFGPWVIE